ncbi:hypothetical protein N007_04900 [Alicyclobacillus acidoterrestris ATCC 49025]|nr:hypothetical protein N007_04900 [Alicyclobacillus acidoterrestris ATCC 49025]
MARKQIRVATTRAFERPRKPSETENPRTPLGRFHSTYEKWLRQSGSKRTPMQVETQQWIFGVVTVVLIHAITGKNLISLIFGAIAFGYPILEMRTRIQRAKRDIQNQIFTVILLLRIYVEGGCTNLQAVRLIKRHVENRMQELFSDAEPLMQQGLTFDEVMNILAEASPSEELEMVADELRRTSKRKADLSKSLTNILDNITHQEHLRMTKAQARHKQGVYMRFMGFFISPLILLTMCYIWGMFSNALHV